MEPVEDPGRGPDPVLRAVVVVALVAAAALGLQARQGLDWPSLADPVQVRWARVLAGSVVLLVLAATARALLRRLRRSRRPRLPAPTRHEPAGERFPLLLRVLLVLLVLAVVATGVLVVDAVSGAAPDGEPSPPEEPTDDGGSARRSVASWWTVVEVAAVLLVAAGVARLVSLRREREVIEEDQPADAPDVGELSAAVEAAEVGLASTTDPRAAIVAAYAAMASRVSAGLARRGSSAPASDTPTELLDRAVSAGLVAEGPATALTGLFREARFSRHPMGEEHRRAAEQALLHVRGDLAARHG